MPIKSEDINLDVHPKIWDKFQCLYDKKIRARYKVFYGGRGGGKSWQFARALLLRAHSEQCKILCTRQIQNTIADSVYEVIEDQAKTIGIYDYFNFQKNYIISKATGSKILFKGLFKNINEIKEYLLG